MNFILRMKRNAATGKATRQPGHFSFTVLHQVTMIEGSPPTLAPLCTLAPARFSVDQADDHLRSKAGIQAPAPQALASARRRREELQETTYSTSSGNGPKPPRKLPQTRLLLALALCAVILLALQLGYSFQCGVPVDGLSSQAPTRIDPSRGRSTFRSCIRV